MKLVIYLFKKILPLFLGAMFFFALVLNLVDLFMNIATYLQNNCSGKEMLLVMLYYIPKTVWYAVPVAILFSTSYALSEMYASNEIQALLASGVSLFRFTVPILIVSLLMAYGLFHFENRFVVQTYEQKTTLQDALLQKTKNENNSNVIVLSENGRIVYSASRYFESQKRLLNCYFIFRGEDRALEAIIYSLQATWNEEEEHWDLEMPKQCSTAKSRTETPQMVSVAVSSATTMVVRLPSRTACPSAPLSPLTETSASSLAGLMAATPPLSTTTI